MDAVAQPIVVALVDDYEVILLGIKKLFDAHPERVVVADIAAQERVAVPVDIALFDTFAQPESDENAFAGTVDNPLVRRTVVYTWVFEPQLIEAAFAKGASGYLSKTLPAAELVDALERIHRGERVVSEQPRRVNVATPDRIEPLSGRETEILALIVQGRSNQEIAALTHLSINSIKTYIRSGYQKIGVTSRARAVRWGFEHGLVPPKGDSRRG